MFFLGLLSTPLPYLLLAAFYFFGFAMGVFNSSNGEETGAELASVTIQAETKEKITEESTYYIQVNRDIQQHYTSESLNTENTAILFIPPDTGTSVFRHSREKNHYEYLFSGFLFSRPPPATC